MMDVVYPGKNRELFSGRSYFLNLLDKNLEKIKNNNGKNIALLGQQFIGKSTILKEFILRSKNINSCYLDFEKIAMSPERFAVEFIGGISFWFLRKNHKEFSSFQDIETLKKIRSELKSEGAARIINEVENELNKIKPDKVFLIESAFSFPQILSKETGKNIIVCVKEFQNVLSLENYEGIKDVLLMFEESIKSVNYIITSSETNSVKKKLEESFSVEEVGNMSKEEISELLEKARKKTDINSVFKLSKGHPLYSLIIAEKNVEKKFVEETLIKQGVIYNSCKNIFHNSLNRARGQTLLKIILKVLAKQEGLRLSEISRKIYRSSPITKNLLSRLMDVDLIKINDKTFSFSDPVLRYWARNMFNEIEFDYSIDEKLMEELVKELE